MARRPSKKLFQLQQIADLARGWSELAGRIEAIIDGRLTEDERARTSFRGIGFPAVAPAYVDQLGSCTRLLVRAASVRKEWFGLDLRLMDSVSDVGSIPMSGTNLAMVANVKGILHFRIFDAGGKVVLDTDETRLTKQAKAIAVLKAQLKNVWPPYELNRSQNDAVVTTVTYIVGHTRWFDETPLWRAWALAEQWAIRRDEESCAYARESIKSALELASRLWTESEYEQRRLTPPKRWDRNFERNEEMRLAWNNGSTLAEIRGMVRRNPDWNGFEEDREVHKAIQKHCEKYGYTMQSRYERS